MKDYDLDNYLDTDEKEEDEFSAFMEDSTDKNDFEKNTPPPRKRKVRKKRRNKKFRIPIGRIFVAVIVLFFAAYFAALIYTSNFAMLETEMVTQFEVDDYVEVTAHALRQEEYIQNTKSGILAYVIDDGQKVNASGTVAKLFSTESDVNNWREYNRISDELTLLQQMTNASSNMFVDLDTVDAQIKNKMTNYKTYLAGNRLNSAMNTKLDLLQLFNERTVITSGSSDFQTRISQLESELNSIRVSDSIGDVRSKHSGIFISGLDGFELSLDYEKAETLTASDISGMVKKDPPSNAVGKIVTTINWYLLCPITSEQALNVTTGNNTVEISIPKVISGTIPGTVIAVNQGSKMDDGLLIIKCDYMDSSLANIREEAITIKTKTYSGLRINRKAIHEDYITTYEYDDNGAIINENQQKVQGVYVMYGKHLYFKQVNIIYSDKDFVICDPDTTNTALLNGETIALHDEVVVQGKDLYDGKAVK